MIRKSPAAALAAVLVLGAIPLSVAAQGRDAAEAQRRPATNEVGALVIGSPRSTSRNAFQRGVDALKSGDLVQACQFMLLSGALGNDEAYFSHRSIVSMLNERELEACRSSAREALRLGADAK